MPIEGGDGETKSKSARAARDLGPAVPTRGRGVSTLGAIWRTMRLHVAFAVAGGVSLHAVLIGSIFYGIAGGGGSGMDRNFCVPMEADAGNFPFGENHSCRIQVGYTAAMFVLGVIFTSAPLLLVIGVSQALVHTWRSYSGKRAALARPDNRAGLAIAISRAKALLTFVGFVGLAAMTATWIRQIDGFSNASYKFVFWAFWWKFVPFIVAPALIIYVADVLIGVRRARDSR